MWALRLRGPRITYGAGLVRGVLAAALSLEDGKVDRLRRKLGPATAAAARLLAERGVSDEGVSFLLACLNPDAETRPDALAISTHAGGSQHRFAGINDRHPSRRPHRRRRSPAQGPETTRRRRRVSPTSRSRRLRSRSASSSPCCPRRRGRPAAIRYDRYLPPVPPPPRLVSTELNAVLSRPQRGLDLIFDSSLLLARPSAILR